ncbi:family 16 glycosylhydrolase [Pelagicoccus mobilis]|uniref:Family 16 glycosylhydrolase n=1 Tax=Pelagicoccus mobilis TaxID=415221 RepID=A0A934VSP6_9BACT|nr:family 16 glycosylhydrolase [Pelagicoccus mobilis]MBK1878719.1 family 16 glycosylhydrolase [Pelagicoccus mobilis]
MKSIKSIALPIIAVASCFQHSSASSILNPDTSVEVGEWQLVWHDEFERDGAPDSRWWTYENGLIRNNEAQFYTVARTENARVENGHLIIEARKEDWVNADYTSASLTTKGLADWTYGRVEIRAQMPAGRGLWPALWMLGSNIDEVGWPLCGEIDILEYVGFDTTTAWGTVHTDTYNHADDTAKGGKITVPDITEAMHNYTLEWEPDKITLSVDESVYFTFTKDANATTAEWPFDLPHYLLLNIAIGGDWGGQEGIDDSIFPVQMLVDYVRIYQRKPAGPYSIDLSSEGPGRLRIDPEKDSYDEGDEITLHIEPEVGMRLADFSGEQAAPNYRIPITVNRPLAFDARFTNPGDILENGDISKAADSWYHWIDDSQSAGSLSFANGEVKATVTSSSPEGWPFQFGQGGISITTGDVYQISFKARANTTARVDVKIARDWGSFTPYETQTIELTEQWENYTLNYQHQEASDSNTRLELNVSFNVGEFWFDDFKLTSEAQSLLGPYEQWKKNNNIPPANDFRDPDEDNMSNIFEYLYARSPSTQEPLNSPPTLRPQRASLQLDPSGGNRTEEQLSDIQIHIEASLDGENWSSVESINDALKLGNNVLLRYHPYSSITVSP